VKSRLIRHKKGGNEIPVYFPYAAVYHQLLKFPKLRSNIEDAWYLTRDAIRLLMINEYNGDDDEAEILGFCLQSVIKTKVGMGECFF